MVGDKDALDAERPREPWIRAIESREVHVEDAGPMLTDDSGELLHAMPTEPAEPRELGSRDVGER